MKKTLKKYVSLLLAMLLVFSLAACGQSDTQQSQPAETSEASEPAEESWVPTEDMTIIVQASAGGGSDIFCRTFAKIANESGKCPVSIVVENMPGSSGALAYDFVGKQQYGNPYYFASAVSNIITTPLQGMCETQYSDFDALARLADDNTNGLVVNAKSQWNTIDEFIEYTKSNPEKVNLAGGSIGSADSIMTWMFEKYVGGKLNYVTFDGSGDTTTALLGNHVDAIWANVSEVQDYISSGDFKVLAVISEERLTSLPEVPSFVELGYPECHFSMFRGFAMPKGTPEGALEYWEELCEYVYNTAEWQEYLTNTGMSQGFMGAEEFQVELDEQFGMYEAVLTDLGLVS